MGSLPKVDIQIEVKLNAGTLTREYGTYTNDVSVDSLSTYAVARCFNQQRMEGKAGVSRGKVAEAIVQLVFE